MATEFDMAHVGTGDPVWISHAEQAWVPGTIRTVDDTTIVAVTTDDEEVSIPLAPQRSTRAKGQVARLLPRGGDTGDGGVENMDDCMFLHEAEILDNIRRRFAHDVIYTATGPILIAMNPYKWLPLYTDKIIDTYASGKTEELPPHCYSVAQESYKLLQESRSSTSIIICGESGAGKTETTKLMLKYISRVASLPSADEISARIMESNPLMEAFGNAKTLRNNNSSRFGKFVRVYFDKEYFINGASITNYLLEKSRCVFQSSGERNYHIFYQLLAGAPPDMKERFKLKRPEDYNYVNRSGCISIAGVDDVEEFAATCEAFATIGLSADGQEQFFRVVAVILHLGNITFRPEGSENDDEDDDNDARIADETHLHNAAELMGVEASALSFSLLNRRIVTGGTTIVKPLDVPSAEACRDALSKAVYAKLFDTLIRIINVSLSSNGSVDDLMSAARARPGRRSNACGSRFSAGNLFMGILDIFGFENLAPNGFEQLFINYANEKLQSLFNDSVFKSEEAEYKREGITWEKTDFPDNQDCLDLIEKRPVGLLFMIDEECLRGNSGNDRNIVSKMQQNHGKHRCYESAGPASAWRGTDRDFVIRHYAGPIKYTVEDFVEKNRDTLFDTLEEMIASSKVKFISALFGGNGSGSMGAIIEAPSGGGGGGGGGAKRGGSLQATVSSKFASEMAELMTTIQATSPRFVRCMKANTKQCSDLFESVCVLLQLTYAGVLAALEMRRAGYPSRFKHRDFVAKFATLMPLSKRRTQATLTDADVVREAKNIFAHQAIRPHIKSEKYAVGKTKVFLRANVLSQLDSLVRKWMRSAVVHVQSRIRGKRQERKFKSIKRGALLLQAVTRGIVDRKRVAERMRQFRRGRDLRKVATFGTETLDKVQELQQQALDHGLAAEKQVVACLKKVVTQEQVLQQLVEADNLTGAQSAGTALEEALDNARAAVSACVGVELDRRQRQSAAKQKLDAAVDELQVHCGTAESEGLQVPNAQESKAISDLANSNTEDLSSELIDKLARMSKLAVCVADAHTTIHDSKRLIQGKDISEYPKAVEAVQKAVDVVGQALSEELDRRYALTEAETRIKGLIADTEAMLGEGKATATTEGVYEHKPVLRLLRQAQHQVDDLHAGMSMLNLNDVPHSLAMIQARTSKDGDASPPVLLQSGIGDGGVEDVRRDANAVAEHFMGLVNEAQRSCRALNACVERESKRRELFLKDKATAAQTVANAEKELRSMWYEAKDLAAAQQREFEQQRQTESARKAKAAAEAISSSRRSRANTANSFDNPKLTPELDHISESDSQTGSGPGCATPITPIDTSQIPQSASVAKKENGPAQESSKSPAAATAGCPNGGQAPAQESSKSPAAATAGRPNGGQAPGTPSTTPATSVEQRFEQALASASPEALLDDDLFDTSVLGTGAVSRAFSAAASALADAKRALKAPMAESSTEGGQEEDDENDSGSAVSAIDPRELRITSEMLARAVAEVKGCVEAEQSKRLAETAERNRALEILAPASNRLGHLSAEVDASDLGDVPAVEDALHSAEMALSRARELLTSSGDVTSAVTAASTALKALEYAEEVVDRESDKRAKDLAEREQAKISLQPVIEKLSRTQATAEVAFLTKLPVVHVTMTQARRELARSTRIILGQAPARVAMRRRSSLASTDDEDDDDEDFTTGAALAMAMSRDESGPQDSPLPRQGKVMWDAAEIQAAVRRATIAVDEAEEVVLREKGVKDKREELRLDGLSTLDVAEERLGAVKTTAEMLEHVSTRHMGIRSAQNTTSIPPPLRVAKLLKDFCANGVLYGDMNPEMQAVYAAVFVARKELRDARKILQANRERGTMADMLSGASESLKGALMLMASGPQRSNPSSDTESDASDSHEPAHELDDLGLPVIGEQGDTDSIDEAELPIRRARGMTAIVERATAKPVQRQGRVNLTTGARDTSGRRGGVAVAMDVGALQRCVETAIAKVEAAELAVEMERVRQEEVAKMREQHEREQRERQLQDIERHKRRLVTERAERQAVLKQLDTAHARLHRVIKGAERFGIGPSTNPAMAAAIAAAESAMETAADKSVSSSLEMARAAVEGVLLRVSACETQCEKEKELTLLRRQERKDLDELVAKLRRTAMKLSVITDDVYDRLPAYVVDRMERFLKNQHPEPGAAESPRRRLERAFKLYSSDEDESDGKPSRRNPRRGKTSGSGAGGVTGLRSAANGDEDEVAMLKAMEQEVWDEVFEWAEFEKRETRLSILNASGKPPSLVSEVLRTADKAVAEADQVVKSALEATTAAEAEAIARAQRTDEESNPFTSSRTSSRDSSPNRGVRPGFMRSASFGGRQQSGMTPTGSRRVSEQVMTESQRRVAAATAAASTVANAMEGSVFGTDGGVYLRRATADADAKVDAAIDIVRRERQKATRHQDMVDRMSKERDTMTEGWELYNGAREQLDELSTVAEVSAEYDELMDERAVMSAITTADVALGVANAKLKLGIEGAVEQAFQREQGLPPPPPPLPQASNARPSSGRFGSPSSMAPIEERAAQSRARRSMSSPPKPHKHFTLGGPRSTPTSGSNSASASPHMDARSGYGSSSEAEGPPHPRRRMSVAVSAEMSKLTGTFGLQVGQSVHRDVKRIQEEEHLRVLEEHAVDSLVAAVDHAVEMVKAANDVYERERRRVQIHDKRSHAQDRRMKSHLNASEGVLLSYVKTKPSTALEPALALQQASEERRLEFLERMKRARAQAQSSSRLFPRGIVGDRAIPAPAGSKVKHKRNTAAAKDHAPEVSDSKSPDDLSMTVRFQAPTAKQSSWGSPQAGHAAESDSAVPLLHRSAYATPLDGAVQRQTGMKPLASYASPDRVKPLRTCAASPPSAQTAEANAAGGDSRTNKGRGDAALTSLAARIRQQHSRLQSLQQAAHTPWDAETRRAKAQAAGVDLSISMMLEDDKRREQQLKENDTAHAPSAAMPSVAEYPTTPLTSTADRRHDFGLDTRGPGLSLSALPSHRREAAETSPERDAEQEQQEPQPANDADVDPELSLLLRSAPRPPDVRSAIARIKAATARKADKPVFPSYNLRRTTGSDDVAARNLSDDMATAGVDEDKPSALSSSAVVVSNRGGKRAGQSLADKIAALREIRRSALSQQGGRGASRSTSPLDSDEAVDDGPKAVVDPKALMSRRHEAADNLGRSNAYFAAGGSRRPAPSSNPAEDELSEPGQPEASPGHAEEERQQLAKVWAKARRAAWDTFVGEQATAAAAANAPTEHQSLPDSETPTQASAPPVPEPIQPVASRIPAPKDAEHQHRPRAIPDKSETNGVTRAPAPSADDDDVIEVHFDHDLGDNAIDHRSVPVSGLSSRRSSAAGKQPAPSPPSESSSVTQASSAFDAAATQTIADLQRSVADLRNQMQQRTALRKSRRKQARQEPTTSAAAGIAPGGRGRTDEQDVPSAAAARRAIHASPPPPPRIPVRHTQKSRAAAVASAHAVERRERARDDPFNFDAPMARSQPPAALKPAVRVAAPASVAGVPAVMNGDEAHSNALSPRLPSSVMQATRSSAGRSPRRAGEAPVDETAVNSGVVWAAGLRQ